MGSALLTFLRRNSKVSVRHLITMSAIAGLSNALLLGIVNAVAENANSGKDANTWFLGLFVTTIAIYYVSQRYLFTLGTREMERIIDDYRRRMAVKIRHCDLDTLEHIGRSFIFSSITYQPQTVSQSSATMILAAQSAVLILFTMGYMAYLSIYAFVLTILIIALAINAYLRKWDQANSEIHQSITMESVLFEGLTDLIEGFKEVRLHTPRAIDVTTFITETSGEVRRLKDSVDEHLSSIYVFAQCTFYLLCGALVFLLPLLGESYSSELLKTTTVILFLIGPLSSVVGTATNGAKANAACEDMLLLEEKLEKATRAPATTGATLSSFKEIQLVGATYEHHDDQDNSTFRIGPIDLTIRPGEILFVSGGNGSGKSTLMKMLTLLYQPTMGLVKLNGKPVTLENREAYQSLFTTVFFDFHLFPRTYGLGKLDEDRVNALLTEMGLEDKTSLKNGTFETIRLSSGQRKRLALIVALLEDRNIYLFDEWAADQDPEFRHRFYEKILPDLKRAGKTVIAVTHDDRYFGYCDRRIAMDEGQVVLEEKGNAQ
ncbi:MAG: cyclic peptide export ABC transporter [Rhodospirillum sp.]|nr:cyclic peptide export ABC transporter [Rhodospirillum sp.]MCF8487785.1 cyclic peptide export ABC transporter [Rhodospirillum sp.]MCF8502238.1 cyclic peptide export ABC transporter [Rhodospirillum sp.]